MVKPMEGSDGSAGSAGSAAVDQSIHPGRKGQKDRRTDVCKMAHVACRFAATSATCGKFAIDRSRLTFR
jgi:hypothetical protein